MSAPQWSSCAAGCVMAVMAMSCTAPSTNAPAQNAPAASTPAAPANAPSGAVTLPPGFPERPFTRVQFDKLTWRPTEGNTLGVETAVVEGDPSKSG